MSHRFHTFPNSDRVLSSLIVKYFNLFFVIEYKGLQYISAEQDTRLYYEVTEKFNIEGFKRVNLC